MNRPAETLSRCSAWERGAGRGVAGGGGAEHKLVGRPQRPHALASRCVISPQTHCDDGRVDDNAVSL